MKARATIKTLILAGTAVGALTAGTIGAQAGGFAVHEQSTYFLGSTFAGAAAGGPSISSMFWNPATMTQAGLGFTTESNYAFLIGTTQITPTTATAVNGANLLGLGASGDIFQDALVPASYFVYKPNDRWAFGVSINAPFGLVTNPNTFWAGEFYARTSKVRTVNVTPQVAYKINDWISIGAGMQIQYFKVELNSAFPGALSAPPLFDQFTIKGDSTDIGITAGITLTPTPWTTIGIGYRSAIDQTITGTISRPPFGFPVVLNNIPLVLVIPGATVAAQTTVNLPDSASLGIRQRVTEQLTLLGTVEWTNWSRIGTALIVTPPPGSVPGVPAALPFQWRDGWFGSVGVEYQWDPALALRVGAAWESSPITDATRGVRLPDADRFWLGAGMSYNWNNMTIELAYAHVFIKDANINLSAASGNPSFNPQLGTFIGTAQGHTDIISLGFRYRWGPEPMRALITKG